MEPLPPPGSENRADRNSRRGVLALFLILVFSITSLFVGAALKRASRTTLWLDEVHALQQSRRGHDYGELLVRGPDGQMSPAPLSYFLEKILDDVRGPLRYLGLTPYGYYRLISICATAVLGLCACLIVWTRIRRTPPGAYALQCLLTAGALGAFFFQHDVFHYSTEMRPYALWNSLWFLALVLVTCRCAPLVLALVLTLTALTSTAAVLQIFALGLALALVMRIEGASWRDVLIHSLKVLLVPALVSLYFSFRTVQWSYEAYGTWTGFIKFWLRSAFGFWVITGAACALAWTRRDLRRHAVGPTAMILVLLLAPVAFMAASHKGMVYSPRHYLYWGLAWPMALVVLALAAPSVIEGKARNLRIAACILILALAALNISGGLLRRVKEYPPGRAQTAFLKPGSEIAARLRKEVPACIRHDPALDPVFAFNLRLLAEWIPICHPKAEKGNRELLIREAGADLVGVLLDESPPANLAKIHVPPTAEP